MGTFNNSKEFYASPSLIDIIADDLVLIMKKEGYEVSKQELYTGGFDISLTKGDIFKAVIGMQTALKVVLRPYSNKIVADATIGIFGKQAVPTVISMLLFWPVLIPQIWGLVQQSKLDDHVFEIIEQSIKKHGSNVTVDSTLMDNVTGKNRTANYASGFCTNCGISVPPTVNFCGNCGKPVIN